MAFDPDAYLKATENQFDPEKYLRDTDSILAKHKTQGLFGSSIGQDSSIVKFLRDAAAKSRSGLRSITNLIPDAETQSVPANIALNTPKTLAEIVSDFSASTFEPETVLTAGALEAGKLAAPAINMAGRWIGNGAERLSGLSYDTPGVLARTVENPSLPFQKGIKAANEMYPAIKDPSQVRDSFKNFSEMLDHKSVVEKSIQALKEGTLTPDEALLGRQSLDQMRSVPNSTFYPLRDAFDKIAKTKFAGADTARAIASDAENVRNLLPLNKTGTPSIGKIMLGGGGMYASHTNPYSLLTLPAFSPVVQAGVASGIGVAKQGLSPFLRNPVATGIGLSELIRRKNQ